MPAKPKIKNSPSEISSVLASLKRLGSKNGLESMARFAIVADKAWGVSMADLQKLAKTLGRNHELAAKLWDAEWYEARMLAALVDEPAKVTPTQMDRWSNDFDNWAICDTVCFSLFDRTPHAWQKIAPWSKRKEEFPKRAAFATLWGLTVHDKTADDAPFMQGLATIEKFATDERNFVKKAVNMALRATGKRNARLHAAALAVAERLAEADDATARWVGKDAARELKSESVARRLAKRK